MIMVNINTSGESCRINLSDNINKVSLQKDLNEPLSNRWSNKMIFLTLFKGMMLLMHKRLMDSLERTVL